jgi:hypothetical protein
MRLVPATRTLVSGWVVVAAASMRLVPAVAEYLVLRVEKVSAFVPGAVHLGSVPECCGKALSGVVGMSAKA